jgi:methyl-accepting chemotaxis protein
MSDPKTQSNSKPANRFLSLRVKIWIGFILIFTPVFVASYYWFYEYTTSSVFQTITDHLGQTITGTLKGMDKAGFVQLYKEEGLDNPKCPPAKDAQKADNGYYPESNPLYMAHENWLLAVQHIEPETRIYTYVKGIEPGEIIAIGSTGYFRQPRGGFKFCQRYTSKSSNIYNGLTRRVDAWTPYKDSFGSWITSYQPILDDKGNSIGAIGIDISANYVDEVRNNILISGAIAFVASYMLIFLLVYWLSGLFTKPIVGLAGAAKAIGEGDYSHELTDQTVNRNFRDEIDTLTAVFKVMVDKVAQREQSLRQQVQELKIEIDQSKRQKHVGEIVDSEFFQELQAKARKMRQQQEKGEDTASINKKKKPKK